MDSREGRMTKLFIEVTRDVVTHACAKVDYPPTGTGMGVPVQMDHYLMDILTID